MKTTVTTDIQAAAEGTLQEGIAVIYENGGSFQTLAFITMVALVPHYPEVFQMGSEISCANPLQGLVYIYLVLEVLCYGCEEGLFTLPDLSVAVEANCATTQCGRVRMAAEAKKAELLDYCMARRLQVPDFDGHFFQFHEEPYLLCGDESSKVDDDTSGDDSNADDNDE